MQENECSFQFKLVYSLLAIPHSLVYRLKFQYLKTIVSHFTSFLYYQLFTWIYWINEFSSSMPAGRMFENDFQFLILCSAGRIN